MKSIFLKKLLRRKFIDVSNESETQLNRCLSTFDLTALGVGATLGAGIYVLAGQIAKETAGPAVVLSFAVAGLAAVFSGLCYAEFGARVPQAGSAYVYSYVTVGEFCAFIIGWNLILEYVIGTASLARAWSSYLDALLENLIKNKLLEWMPMYLHGLSPYPDLFALGLTLLLTAILIIGVKESTNVNNIFTVINIFVVLYVIICGFFKVSISNWTISKEELPSESAGSGGFLPFGFSGVLAGAATCFFAFVGFDVIATTGEETKNPQKSIPISIMLSLLISFISYCSVSAILTLMWPYYDLNTEAPLTDVFDKVGWPVGKYIITVGALCALSSSLFGGIFPLPRIIYAMANDGLLFRCLSNINSRLKTPILATIISGIFTGLMAMFFELKDLIDMMSIGTLLAYFLVAVSVIILRYRPNISAEDSTVSILPEEITSFSVIKNLYCPLNKNCTTKSSSIVNIASGILGIAMVALATVLIYAIDYLKANSWWAILLAVLLALLIVLMVFVIWRQPQNLKVIPFKVPFLPFIPALSMFINIYLMLKLSADTWIRFAVWMALGFIIYFGYGIWNSTLNQEVKAKSTDVQLEVH